MWSRGSQVVRFSVLRRAGRLEVQPYPLSEAPAARSTLMVAFATDFLAI